MDYTLIFNSASYLVLLLAIIFLRKRNYLAQSIVLFYFLGSFCAICVPMNSHYYFADIFITANFNENSLLYLFGIFCLFLVPVLRNGINFSNPILPIISTKNKILFLSSLFYFCILLISIFIIVFYILKNGISLKFSFTSKDDALDNLAMFGTIVNYFFKFSDLFQDIFLVYAFYLLFNYSAKKYAVCMIVGIILFSICYSMLALARNNMIHTIFSLMLLLILFRMYSNQKIYKVLKKISLIIISIIMGIILYVSILRFFSGSNDAEYTQFILLRYAGEPMLNFSSWIERIQNNCMGVKNFSSILSLLHLEPSRSFEQIRDYCFNRTNIPSYIFYTFIGSFIFDFGYIFTFIIALSAACFFSKKETEYTSFTRVSFFYFYSLFLLDGYFFFYYASKNIKLLATFFFLLFLKFSISAQEEEQ